MWEFRNTPLTESYTNGKQVAEYTCNDSEVKVFPPTNYSKSKNKERKFQIEMEMEKAMERNGMERNEKSHSKAETQKC